MSNVLFVTTIGKNKGGPVSTDSLRKHVTSIFGKGTAAHSLRKGGAQFYSRRGLDQDATRQQGGWKTSEVMAMIYTKLSAEVRQKIGAVVITSSLLQELQARLQKLGTKPEEAAAARGPDAWSALNLFKQNLHAISTRMMFDTQVPKLLKSLIRRSDVEISSCASRLHTTLHADWMAQQAAKRRRVQS